MPSVDVLTHIESCKNCDLHCKISRKPMIPGGDATLPVMLIADSPGIEDYRNNLPFSSSSGGSVLWEALSRAGFEPNSFYRTNVVKCHNPSDTFDGNTPLEIFDCEANLDIEIKEFKPKIICVFGNAGLYRFSELFDQEKELYDTYKNLVSRESVEPDEEKQLKELNKQLTRKLTGILDKSGSIFYSTKYECYVMHFLNPTFVSKQRSKYGIFQESIMKLKEYVDSGFKVQQAITQKNYTLMYPLKYPSYAEFVDEASKFLQWVKDKPVIAVDTETTGLNWSTDQITHVIISWGIGEAVSIKWDPILVSDLSAALSTPSLKIMHNSKFDCHFFRQAGVKVNNFKFDTMIAAHLIDENNPVGLEALTPRYLGLPTYKNEFWNKIKTLEEGSVEYEELIGEYGCSDADNTFRLYVKFSEMLKELGLDSLFNRISMPFCNTLTRIEENGLDFNRTYYNEVHQLLLNKLKDCEAKATDILYKELYPDPRSFLHHVHQSLPQDCYSEVKDFISKISLDEMVKSSIISLIDAFHESLKKVITESADDDLSTDLISTIEILSKGDSAKTRTGLIPVLKSATSKRRASVNRLFKKLDPGTDEHNEARLELEYIDQIGSEILTGLENLRQTLIDVSGLKINLASPKEMSNILYEVLKLPVNRKLRSKETKAPSTSKEAVEELTSLHPFPKYVAEYRNHQHSISNCIDGLVKWVSPIDNRLHPNFQQTRTVTGRTACGEPALHGIPREFMLRNMFQPRPGFLFIEADLSAAEVRVLAEISGDEELKAAFAAGGDIHMQNAVRIHKCEPHQVTKEMRAGVKRIVFAILYGAHIKSVAADLGISENEAQELFDAFYKVYPRVKEWMDETIQFAADNGYVVNYYGRRRRLPEMQSPDFWVRQEAERQCINSVIQSSATGDYIGLVHIKIQEHIDKNYDPTLVRQVHSHHDAILVECPAELAWKLKDEIQEIGETADENMSIRMVFEADVVCAWSSVPMKEHEIQEYIKDSDNHVYYGMKTCDYVSDKGKKCGTHFYSFKDHTKCPDHCK